MAGNKNRGGTTEPAGKKVKRYVVLEIKDRTIHVEELIGTFGPEGNSIFVYHKDETSYWCNPLDVRATPKAAVALLRRQIVSAMDEKKKEIATLRQNLKNFDACKTIIVCKAEKF